VPDETCRDNSKVSTINKVQYSLKDQSVETGQKDDALKEYKEDIGINLSELDEDQKRELLDLDRQIEKDDLTRGERRRLQNKRNVLKAKIKKDVEIECHK